MEDTVPESSPEPETQTCPTCQNVLQRRLPECPKCGNILTQHTFLPEQLAEFKKYSLGKLLLKQREYLFESIYKGERTAYLIGYCMIYSLLFTSFYGFIFGAHVGLGYGLAMIALAGATGPEAMAQQIQAQQAAAASAAAAAAAANAATAAGSS